MERLGLTLQRAQNTFNRNVDHFATSYFISSEKETEKILGSEVKKELIQNLLKLNQILSEK